MPFRRRFDCLWCGQAWGTRSDDDLEGWAALCPDCLAKADDNGFLRNRLRTALRDRAASASAAVAGTSGPAGDWEDWYLRRGRYARGPIHDGPWTMELDEVTRWVDGLSLAGTLVELGAGMGWWTALLADKGELWVYDRDGASLDAARTRLMAHGLLAHLHERDPLARPDKTCRHRLRCLPARWRRSAGGGRCPAGDGHLVAATGRLVRVRRGPGRRRHPRPRRRSAGRGTRRRSAATWLPRASARWRSAPPAGLSSSAKPSLRPRLVP